MTVSTGTHTGRDACVTRPDAHSRVFGRARGIRNLLGSSRTTNARSDANRTVATALCYLFCCFLGTKPKPKVRILLCCCLCACMLCVSAWLPAAVSSLLCRRLPEFSCSMHLPLVFLPPVGVIFRVAVFLVSFGRACWCPRLNLFEN